MLWVYQFGVFYSTASSFSYIIPAQQATKNQFLIQENGQDISFLLDKINTKVGCRLSPIPTDFHLAALGIRAQFNNA